MILPPLPEVYNIRIKNGQRTFGSSTSAFSIFWRSNNFSWVCKVAAQAKENPHLPQEMLIKQQNGNMWSHPVIASVMLLELKFIFLLCYITKRCCLFKTQRRWTPVIRGNKRQTTPLQHSSLHSALHAKLSTRKIRKTFAKVFGSSVFQTDVKCFHWSSHLFYSLLAP